MDGMRDAIIEDLRTIEGALGRMWAWVGAPPAEMVRYSQNDSRWARVVYAGGATFAESGCLVVVATMVASQVYPELLPPAMAVGLNQQGAFDGVLLSRPARIPLAFPLLRWDGYVHWRSTAADLARLAEEIVQGGPTIVELVWSPLDPRPPQEGNQHFAVAVAVVGKDVAIVDPFDGQDKLVSLSRYAQPAGWSAARAIYGMRLLRVEGEMGQVG